MSTIWPSFLGGRQDVSHCRIAEILGRSPSTIGREICRNRGQRGYRPKQAERWAQERRKTPRSVKMTPEVVTYIEEKTRIGNWEADLVSGTRHRGFLVTLVERRSKYTLIGHVKQKIAADVTTEIMSLLTPHEGDGGLTNNGQLSIYT